MPALSSCKTFLKIKLNARLPYLLTNSLPCFILFPKHPTPALLQCRHYQRQPVRHSRQKGNPTHVPLLSPSAPVAFRSSKALCLMCLLFLSLMALPVYAQWVAVDQTGAPLNSQSRSQAMIYPFLLSQTGTIHSDYPPAAAGSPASSPIDALPSYGNECSLDVFASNSGSNGNGNHPGFYVTPDGIALPENGTVTGTADGRLEARYKYTGPLPVPLYLDLMMTPTLVAETSNGYENSGLTSGLFSTAQITSQVTLNDGSPVTLASLMNTAADASSGQVTAGDAQTLTKSYFLRVPVVNGMVKVVLDGLMSGSASNPIPYGLYDPHATTVTNGETQAYSGTGIYGTIQQAGPPKSLMINGPMVSTQVFDGSQWTGSGDTRFDNQEIESLPTFNPLTVGEDFTDPSWSAGLVGSPWPSAADLYDPLNNTGEDVFYRNWAWNSTPQSDSGDTFDIHSFMTDRPRADWPWDSLLNYQPHDFLELCQNGPAPVQKHIFLHLTDEDALGNHPEWNFDNTANYYVTYHNEVESPTNIITGVTPLSDNAWKEYIGPGNTVLSADGIAPSTDSNGNPIQGTGTYPWNPGSATVSVEYNWGGSLDVPVVDVNGSINKGSQVTQNIPATVIPIGYRGTVYWHAPTNRLLFNFRHYLVGGEDIQYDANGNVLPHRGFADRPVGGIGTTSADFIVWVQLDGLNFPPSTTLDLKGMH